MRALKLIISVIVCLWVGVTGSFVNGGSEWYDQLVKPVFTPPGWIFGPVWTILYILMGISVFLIWDKGLRHPKVKPAIAIFLVQLALNAIWTPLFFGMHLILLAFIDIILLLIAIIATIWIFKKISTAASLLLLPYLGWVTFAAVLNFSIYYLNR